VFVGSNDQLGNVLTKNLKRTLNWIYLFQAWHIQFACSNLRGKVLE